MKAVVASFNQEKALVGAFSVTVQLHRLIDLRHLHISSDGQHGLTVEHDECDCGVVGVGGVAVAGPALVLPGVGLPHLGQPHLGTPGVSSY